MSSILGINNLLHPRFFQIAFSILSQGTLAAGPHTRTRSNKDYILYRKYISSFFSYRKKLQFLSITVMEFHYTQHLQHCYWFFEWKSKGYAF